MTPKRTMECKFTFGMTGRKNNEEEEAGCVKKAKRKLEEQIRKEKREKQLEGIRKPILTTPNAKRERKEEGKWLKGQGAAKGTPAPTGTSSSPQSTRKTSWREGFDRPDSRDYTGAVYDHQYDL